MKGPETMQESASQPRSHGSKPRKRRKRSALPSVVTPSPFRILDEPVAVEEDGASGQISFEDAVLFKDYERAISGNSRALKRMVKKLIQREMARPKPRRRSGKGEKFLLEPHDPQNARDAMEILGIIAEDPYWSDPPMRFFLIEPWAIEATLRRKRFGPMSRMTIDLVKAWTRDKGSISWPEPFEGDYHGNV